MAILDNMWRNHIFKNTHILINMDVTKILPPIYTQDQFKILINRFLGGGSKNILLRGSMRHLSLL